MNWPAGCALWLLVVACTRLLLDSVGDHSSAWLLMPASGFFTLLASVAFGRLTGSKQLVAGCAAGYLGLSWLMLSSLMFLSPDRINSTVRAAWPHLRLGASFYLVRLMGLMAVLAMSLFLALALSHRLLDREFGRFGGREVNLAG